MERAAGAWPVLPGLPRTRGRRALALGAGYLALTLLFVVIGFPYERLAPRVAAFLEPLLGARLTIGRVQPSLSWGLPQLLAWDVEATWPGGQPLRLERMRLRPAWSTSWVTGNPAFVVALRSPDGELDGTVRLGDSPGFDGSLAGVALARLPASPMLLGTTLDGRLDADLDLRRGADGLEGTASLRAANGSIGLPSLPVGIPFTSLTGELVFGGESQARADAIALEGPVVALQASGTLGRAASPMLAPLALQVRIEARDPNLAPMIAGNLPMGPDGVADFEVGGTLGAPQVQRPGRTRGPRTPTP
jgi:type II secretion system protein N